MSTEQSATPTRRAVLAGAAAVGAAGALGTLAACGSDTADGGGADTGAPTGGQDARPTGAIVKTSEVPVGGGKVVVKDNAKVVVTQPVAGEFVAFSAICTHAGCTVDGISDGEIHCPCHGSVYDAATGEVLVGANGMDPRVQAPLASIPVTVADDTVSYA